MIGIMSEEPELDADKAQEEGDADLKVGVCDEVVHNQGADKASNKEDCGAGVVPGGFVQKSLFFDDFS